MMLHLKRWLTPPVFPDDEGKTRRASVLNVALLTTLALVAIILVGGILGGRTPPIIIGADVAIIIMCLILRRWMHHDRVRLASTALIGVAIVCTTGLVAILGTIRVPTTAFYLLIVVVGGLLFDVGGIVVTTVLSSLAILGLIVAENAGMLPSPDYTVTITQWITYTALSGFSGGLTFVALQSTRQALQRADREIAERERIEEALRASEGRYRRLVEGSPDIVYVFSDRRGGLYYSSSTESTLGYSPAHLCAHPFLWNESIHADDRARVTRAIQEFAAGQAFDIEYRVRDAGGKWHWLRDRSIGRRTENGESFIEGLAMDITDWKQAEEALRENEEQLRTLNDNLPEAALYRYTHDIQGQPHFAYISAGIERLTGIAPFDIINDATSLLRTIMPEDTPRFVQAEAKSRETLSRFEIEVRERHSLTGEVHWVLLRSSPRRQADGSTVWDGVHMDITDRKQAEEALRVSEQKFRSFVEQSSEGFTLVDEQGDIIEWNRAREQMTGLTRDQVIGRLFWDVQHELLPPEERSDEVYERRRQTIQDALRTGESYIFGRTLEAHLMRPDGEQRVSQQTVFPIKTDQGHRIGSTSRDVTEQRSAEEALRASEANLSRAQAVAHIGSWQLDIAGDTLRGSAEAYRMFSVPMGTKLTVEDFYTYVHPDDREDVNRAWQAALHGAAHDIEHRIVVRGETKWVRERAEVEFDAAGRAVSGIGTVQDITDRKQAENKLQQRTRELDALQATVLDIASPHPVPELLQLIVERASNLLASSGGSLYLCHPERQEVECVVSYNTLHDYTGLILTYGEGAAGVTAQTGQPLHIKDYRTWNKRAKILDTDQPFTSVLSAPLIWRGNVIGIIHVNDVRPFTDDDLDLLLLFANHAAIAIEQARLNTAVEQELAERQRAEEALRQLNAELELRVAERTRELTDANARLTELDRLKDEFISRISHELRTPLANVKLYLELLGHGKPEKYEQYLQTVQVEANKLHRHIDDLLEVSHLQTTDIEPQLTRVDVNRLVQDMIADQLPTAETRGLSLTMAAMTDRPSVTSNWALVWQVLSRLMANALAYTPRGGAVTLSTDRCAAGDQAWLTIEVRDTGPGISDKDLPYIFEPFYRGAAASNYKTPGTGVGLPIARRTIEQLGGRIIVDSQPGQGSAFTIWLRAE